MGLSGCSGRAWASLSLLCSCLLSWGFYLPQWIQGTMRDGTEVGFGSFRRCNYPALDGPGGALRMVHECGRYTSFKDIPSLSWQVSTVCVGVGAGLSLLVAFTALSGLCIDDVITRGTARWLGTAQIAAAMLVGVGCGIYPNGWSSREVRDVCGPEAGAYKFGSCQASWSAGLLGSGLILLVLCAGLSLGAAAQSRPR